MSSMLLLGAGPTAGGGGAALIYADTFTGANNTTLHARAMAAGGKSWSEINGNTHWKIQGNKARCTNSYGTLNDYEVVQANLDPLVGSSGMAGNGTFLVTVTTLADSTYFLAGLAFRLPADGTWDHGGYALLFNGNGGDGMGFELYSMQAGETGTHLTGMGLSGAPSPSPDTAYELKVVVNGTSIAVYLDGVLIDTKIDATYGTSRTGIGLLFESDSTSQSCDFDGFSVTPA